MGKKAGSRAVPFTMNRRMVVASATVGREHNTIHAMTEVDISRPRRLMREHQERTGERLSLTAYVVTCLARAVTENPSLNSFRRGSKLILLDDVTVSALIEREIAGERVPEPLGIRAAQAKTYRQIHDEIRAAQQPRAEGLGGLSGATWVRFIPGFLLKAFVRAASHNVRMVSRYGAIGVTAVGMFGSGALWFVPLSAATVVITVGSIVERPVLSEGRLETREHLCLTATFDHDIVDGAPAARFVKRFSELLSNGELLAGALAAPVDG